MIYVNNYFKKYGLITNGKDEINCPPIKSIYAILYSGLISFIGIFTIMILQYHTDFTLVIASFGASAVLIYDSIEAPLAQPRNVIGGHIISAIIGVGLEQLFSLENGKFYFTPLVGALAVSFSIMGMCITRTVHPPGGATSLIAIIGTQKIKDLGFFFILYPIGTGIIILVFISVILNNLNWKRRYPSYWY